MLAERQITAKTLVCVGLDPLLENLPKPLAETYKHNLPGAVAEWMKNITDATAPLALMFKPQIAHWEAIPDGIEMLRLLIRHIHCAYPTTPVFLDCKRGDIARTQQQYRKACLDRTGADGMNFCPYMGKDTMSALVDKGRLDRALVGLCYTSNPDAREVQDVTARFCNQNMPYWAFIANRTLGWAQDLGVVENAGLVMAAAYENPKGSGNVYSEHLVRCRQIVGDKLWFLIPGVGKQQGHVAETVHTAYTGPGSIAINSSSGITEASSGPDYAEAAAGKACELRDQINASL